MKRILLSALMILTLSLASVILVVPATNDYRAMADTPETNQWRSDHAVILAKTVSDIVPSDEALVYDAISDYHALPAASQAELVAEIDHLEELSNQVILVSFIENNSAVWAMTEATVEQSDYPAVMAAHAQYLSLDPDMRSQLTDQAEHIRVLLRKLASPAVKAMLDKYDDFLTKPDDQMTSDDFDTASFMSIDRLTLTYEEGEVLSAIAQPKIAVLNELLENSEYCTGFYLDHDVTGDAREEMVFRLSPCLYKHGYGVRFVIDKTVVDNDLSAKIPGAKKQSDIVWSRDIDMFKDDGSQISDSPDPVRLYLKISDQETLKLLREGRISMVHIHQMPDGSYDIGEQPFKFYNNQDSIVFTTRRFSKFVLVRKNYASAPRLAETGANQLAVGLLAATVSLASLVGLLSIRRARTDVV